MIVRRGRARGRPGLVGTMARTAVVAGTATAVSGGMTRRANQRAMESEQAQMYQDQQNALLQAQMLQAQQAAMAQTPPPAAAPPQQPVYRQDDSQPAD
jgi:hypothetical protein